MVSKRLPKPEGVGCRLSSRANRQRSFLFSKRLNRLGALQVGVDIDGYGSYAMAIHNQPVFRKSVEDLKELVTATSFPVIFKGIMSVEFARAALDSGAAAIVVSKPWRPCA